MPSRHEDKRHEGKRHEGTTLIYDATNERYLRTEMYATDDPSATVELRIVEEPHPRFCDREVDDSSGPWRRVTQRVDAVQQEADASFARLGGPNTCGEWPSVGTSKTLDGMPTIAR